MTPKQIRTLKFQAMTTNFDSAMENLKYLNVRLDETSCALNEYPRGEMGLTPDNVKRTSQWQADRRAFDDAMRDMIELNSIMLRKYKKEYRKHIQQKRGY